MKRFCVMLLEDDLVTAVALAKTLNVAMPDELILTARSMAEARMLLKSMKSTSSFWT